MHILDVEALASVESCSSYPDSAPFSPSIEYPEYPFLDINSMPNSVYDAVRNHLINLKLDTKNVGKKTWNPFGVFNLKGKCIVIKPNWVLDYHPDGKNIWCVITHPSFLRPILDYIYIATNGDCQVTIGDSPIQEADFNTIITLSQLPALKEYFAKQGMTFYVEDFRLEQALRDEKGHILSKEKIPACVDKSQSVQLGKHSMHHGHDQVFRRYRVTNYNRQKMYSHHRNDYHEYLLSKRVLESHFFINVPKLKVHKRAGVTLSIKNLVGINCSKDYLPHHQRGAKTSGGDEYQRPYLLLSLGVIFSEWRDLYSQYIIRWPIDFFARVFMKLNIWMRRLRGQTWEQYGCWHGNDTIWRTALDLNRALFYTTVDGQFSLDSKRVYLTIIDGVIGGEGEAPLQPDPVDSRISIAALNPLYSDVASAVLIGLDPRKISIIREGFSTHSYPLTNVKLEEIKACGGDIGSLVNALTLKPIAFFKPSKGWKGFIELDLEQENPS